MLIAIGVVAVVLVIGIVYFFAGSGFSANAISKLRQTSNSLQKTSTTSTVAPTTAMYLEYNKTVLLESNGYRFFGENGYEIPRSANGLIPEGALNMSVGPYKATGYLNISYFTVPSYPITLEVYSSNGTTQHSSMRFLILIPIGP